jgi:hypothetical protein
MDILQITSSGRISTVILICGPPAWGGGKVGEGLTTAHLKKRNETKTDHFEMSHRASGLAGRCEQDNKASGSIKGR